MVRLCTRLLHLGGPFSFTESVFELLLASVFYFDNFIREKILNKTKHFSESLSRSCQNQDLFAGW